MKKGIYLFRKFEFEYRIFFSLSIVTIIVFSSLNFFESSPVISVLIGNLLGVSKSYSASAGYYLVAIIILFASLLRMWSGSVLLSDTIMSFKIQSSNLRISGPYSLVRNPIYLADLIAFSSFTLVLKPVGLLLPILIYLHYIQLVLYEEGKLKSKFPDQYADYLKSAPRFIPGLRSIKSLFSGSNRFFINWDGFRHNAQYILFIPGMIVAASTENLLHAILIGCPAVIDWAIIHTRIGVAPEKFKKGVSAAKSAITSESKVLSSLLYSQCWEDPEPDIMALNIKEEDIIFTITSGGCNALAFLTCMPGKIYCLDMNSAQNYLLELKMASFKHLSYKDLLQFFGVTNSSNRLATYKTIRASLSQAAAEFWDNKQSKLEKGLIHAGRYEDYMKLLKRVFYFLIGKKRALEVFSNNISDYESYFEENWNNLRWRLFFKVFLSKWLMVILFDRGFYTYIEKGFRFDRYYQSAVKRAITQLPVRKNHFLAYILTGNYLPEALPIYLREENYMKIREKLDAISINTSGCLSFLETLPDNCISGFNFTNIFEWMSPDEFEKHLIEVARTGKKDAAVIYRNHLVTRKRPDSLSKLLIPDYKLSTELWERDLSFIYKDYVLERVNK